MSEPTLDWSTAEVKESKLTVQVDGELPKGWKATFNTTVNLLGGGPWGEIKLKRGNKAEVSGATPGSEDKLKHFLESVVQQANATHELPEEEEKDENEEDEQTDEEDGSEGPDAEMSERFRSFAESTEGDHSPE